MFLSAPGRWRLFRRACHMPSMPEYRCSKWRPPTPAELEKLVTPRPWQRGNCVALSKLLEEGQLEQVQEKLRAVRTRFGDPRELNEELLEISIHSLKSKYPELSRSFLSHPPSCPNIFRLHESKIRQRYRSKALRSSQTRCGAGRQA